MTLWVCMSCTTKYAVGLYRCPRCTGTEFYEDGTMPKISKFGGATNGTENPAVIEPPTVIEPPEVVDPPATVDVTAHDPEIPVRTRRARKVEPPADVVPESGDGE